ncbi:hypothetical protein WPG_1762 [Winogradskyella sp. PG-2]|nr:hypothetical protein WPG_1762 [Winogradskyella sp. PG-2]
MIGYDGDAPGTAGDNDFDIDVRNIANSVSIKDDLITILNTYSFDLNPIVVNPGTAASDHSRFWNQGYSAVLVGESWETNDQTPDYHTSGDQKEDIDFQYMTEITKLITVYLATAAGFDPTLSNAELSNSEVIIFPNPVSSVLNVSNNSLQDLKISIYDITGKLIKSKESNSQNIELDVRQNRTGVYFVNVASETKSSTYKIVKE